MSNIILVKNYDVNFPQDSIDAYRFVAFSGASGQVKQASGGRDKIMGVSGELGSIGSRVDVVRLGIAQVEYGEDIEPGDPLTSDDKGRAVKASPGLAAIGCAELGGSLGTVGEICFALSPAKLTNEHYNRGDQK